MKPGARITARHARAAGFCVSGQSRVLERYGISEIEFYTDGISIDDHRIAGTVNPLILRCRALAIEEWEKNNGK